MRYLMLLVIVCVLAACQHSPQKRYFVLSPTVAKTSADAQTNVNMLIGIGPIELADYLKRSNMVRMRTNNTLNLTANDYWAEPLEKGIARVLSLNLTQLEPSRMVQPFPWRRDSIPLHSLRLQIHELILTNGKAMMNATWELVDSEKKQSIVRQHFTRQLNAGSSAKAMAEAYSQLLGQLAETMDVALKAAEQQNSQ